MEYLRGQLSQILVTEEITSNTELILRNFLSIVNQTTSTEAFLEKLFKCSGNADRLCLVKQHFQWQPMSPDASDKFEKSSQVSQKLTELGDQLYQESFLSAVRAYNLASLFSLPGGTDIKQPARKSRFLLESKSSKFLINEEASGNNCSKESLNDSDVKQNMCKISCNEHIYRPEFEGASMRNAALMKEVQLRGKYYQDLFRLESCNPSMPAVHADVDVRVDPARGRGLYATRDIPIGTTLLVEDPFVAVLSKALDWDVEHCHHCFKQIYPCIPCPGCVFTVYCSATCQNNAKEYHQYECPCLPQLHLALKDEILSNFHIVFKLICSLGPKRLFSMFRDNILKVIPNERQFQTKLSIDKDLQEKYSFYLPIHNLMSKIYPKEGYYFIFMSLVLARTLRERTTFFEEIPREQSAEFEDFIAEIILHNFETFRKNVFGLSEVSLDERVQLANIVTLTESVEKLDCSMKTFAAGVLPSASFLNHSCDPNVIRFTGLKFGQTAFVTLRSLSKDEELRISYGPTFGSVLNDAESRQTDLIYGYDFKCDCVACRNAWEGVLPTEVHSKKEFHCPDCSMAFSYEEKAEGKASKCRLSRDFICKACGKKYCQRSFEQEMKKHQMAIEISKKLVLTNNPLACIESLKRVLEVLGRTVCPPSSQVLLGQILFEDALNLVISLSELPPQLLAFND